MMKSDDITPDEIRIAIRAIKAEAKQEPPNTTQPSMNEDEIKKMFRIICDLTRIYTNEFAVEIAERAQESCSKAKNIEELKDSIDFAIYLAKRARNNRLDIKNKLDCSKISQTDIVNLKMAFAYEKKKYTCMEKLCELIKKVNNSNSIEFQNIEEIEANTMTTIKNAKRSIKFWSNYLNCLVENELKNAIESLEKARKVRIELQNFSSKIKELDNVAKTQLEKAIIDEKNKVALVKKLQFSFEEQNEKKQDENTDIAIKITKETMQLYGLEVKNIANKSINNAIENVNNAIKSVEDASNRRYRIYTRYSDCEKKSDIEIEKIIDDMEIKIEYERIQVKFMKEHTKNFKSIVYRHLVYEKNKYEQHFNTGIDYIKIAKEAVILCSELDYSIPTFDNEDKRKHRETNFYKLKKAIRLVEDAICDVEDANYNLDNEIFIDVDERKPHETRIEEAIINKKNKVTFMEECIVRMKELFKIISIECQENDACTCPICLELLDPTNSVRVDECSHVYHDKCIRNMTKCPLCKGPITLILHYQ